MNFLAAERRGIAGEISESAAERRGIRPGDEVLVNELPHRRNERAAVCSVFCAVFGITLICLSASIDNTEQNGKIAQSGK